MYRMVSYANVIIFLNAILFVFRKYNNTVKVALLTIGFSVYAISFTKQPSKSWPSAFNPHISSLAAFGENT